jgi:hypothetical protein
MMGRSFCLVVMATLLGASSVQATAPTSTPAPATSAFVAMPPPNPVVDAYEMGYRAAKQEKTTPVVVHVYDITVTRADTHEVLMKEMVTTPESAVIFGQPLPARCTTRGGLPSPEAPFFSFKATVTTPRAQDPSQLRLEIQQAFVAPRCENGIGGLYYDGALPSEGMVWQFALNTGVHYNVAIRPHQP